MTSFSITDHRLRSLQIARTAFSEPGPLAAWLGAVQAQDYASGLWSLGLRLPHATAATIERALADRTLIRTWAMRGTLHLLAPADARWIVGLTAPPVLARMVSIDRKRGLDGATIQRSQAALRAALAGGAQLTRQEAIAALEAAGVATAGGLGVPLLNRAALEQVICLGPLRGKQPTFVLFDEWVPSAQPMPREEALAELARRYFSSHGPATVQDFAWWSGLSGADARAGLAAAAHMAPLEQVEIDGRTYWFAPGPAVAADRSPTVYLMPGFDEYMLGYTDRSAAITAEDWQRISPDNGIFAPILVVDGRVAGTWKRTLKRDRVMIAVSPFGALSPAQHAAIDGAAERYGDYLGLAPEVAVGPPAGD